MLAFLVLRPGPDGGAADSPEPTTSAVATATLRGDTPVAELDDPAVDRDECPEYSGPSDPRKTYGDIKNEMESAVVSLQGSAAPAHWLAASIMLASEKPEVAMQLLQKLVTIDSTSALAAWLMLSLCDQRNIDACQSTGIEDTAIQADGDNGLMWAQIANRRLATGREAEARVAMQRAVLARRFDAYFGEQTAVLERAFAAVTGWSYPERIVYTTGSATSNSSSLVKIRDYCRRTDTAEWVTLCDQLGERIFVEGGESAVRLLGIEMRQAVLESRGDDDTQAALNRDHEDLKALQATLFDDPGELNLLLNDESVMREFINTISAYGESEAALRLQERTEDLRATPGYNQCNFLSNPFILMERH